MISCPHFEKCVHEQKALMNSASSNKKKRKLDENAQTAFSALDKHLHRIINEPTQLENESIYVCVQCLHSSRTREAFEAHNKSPSRLNGKKDLNGTATMMTSSDDSHYVAFNLKHQEFYCFACQNYLVFASDIQKHSYLPTCLISSPSSFTNGANPQSNKKRKLEVSRASNLMKTPRRDADAYRQNLFASVPSDLIGLRGLNNLGNTCFMNCVLQSLCHNPLLRNYFLGLTKPLKLLEEQQSESDKKQKFRSVDIELQKLIHEMYGGVSIPYSPSCFLYTMWNVAGHLAGYQQQDAHEFFMAILGALSSTHLSALQSNCVVQSKLFTKKSALTVHQPTNIADLVFRGLLQSDVVCSSCGNVSITHDPFLDISLQLKTADSEVLTSLSDCLHMFTRTETLGRGVYSCEECKSNDQITKQLAIKTLPMTLCFHLKRFSHGDGLNGETKSKRRSADRSSLNGKKISDHIVFESEIDMFPYTSENLYGEVADSSVQKKIMYSLFAVVEHKGDMDGGHYTCFVKHNSKWYLCDDSLIFASKEEEVLACQAYLLFYVRSELPYKI